MPIESIVIQGQHRADHQTWYGKIEQRNNQETLVLFLGNAERSVPKKLKDKIDGIEKAEKLASEFINDNKINLTDRFPGVDLLGKYINSKIQNNEVLDNTAKLLSILEKDAQGHVNLGANLVPHQPGPKRQISISWEP